MAYAIVDEQDMPVAGGPGSQVAERLKKPGTMWGLIQDAVRRLGDRDDLYRLIGDQYDRLPPDSPGALAHDGLAWTANINWGGMEEGIDGIVEAYHNFATRGDVALRLRFPRGYQAGSMSAKKKADILAEEDKEMLSRWPDYYETWEEMLHYFACYGAGLFYWSQPHGWEWCTTHPSNFLYPAGLRKNPTTWPWIALRTKTSLLDLIAKLEDPAAATAMGWNPANIRIVLRKFAEIKGVAVPDGIYLGGETFARGVNDLDDRFIQAARQDIDTYTCYVREWNGEVSERLLVGVDTANPLWLYDVNNGHKRMPFQPFYISVGQGLLDRVRGYGEKMLPYFDLSNKSINHLFDTTWLASSLILQGNSGDDIEKVMNVVFGPFTLLENGVTLQQQAIANPGQGLFQMMEFLDSKRSDRSASAGAPPKVDNREKTLGEAQLEFAEGKTLESFQKARFRTYLNSFAQQRWDRIIDDDMQKSDPGYDAAKEMLERAQDRGVTEADIKAIVRVEAHHVFGDGDPVQQLLTLRAAEPFILRSGSAEGIRNLSIDAAASALGDRETALDYIGEAQVDDRDNRQRHDAQLENAALEASDARIDVIGTEDHALHVGEHLVFLEDKASQLDQNVIAPEDAFKVLSRGLAHVQGDQQRPGHLPRLAQIDLAVESGVFDDARRRVADLENLRLQLAQQLEAQRGAEQEKRLEELREPKPDVLTVEKVMTERVLRDAGLEKIRAETEAVKMKARADLEAKRIKSQDGADGRTSTASRSNGVDLDSPEANGFGPGNGAS